MAENVDNAGSCRQNSYLLKCGIKRWYGYISENLDAKSLISDLYSREVLETEEYQHLIQQDNNYGSISQSKLLLDKVLAGNKVQQFVAILSEKNPYLHKVISKEVEQEIGFCKDLSSPNMDKPIPLIETINGKMQLNLKAKTLFSNCDVPASVISILGKYRTGKSYIMNRFFKSNSGFELGATIESHTKGIWMWVKPHPLRENAALVLLDIEGLWAVDQEDDRYDMKLFCLALLTSKVMIYNVQNVIDGSMLQEINFMSELTDYIKLKETQDEDESEDFASHFPHLCFLIRDFDKQLIIDGQNITADEYLENALKEKENKKHKKSIDDYNRPRKCIKEYFPKRNGFTLCKPLEDTTKLHSLDQLQDNEIKEEFINDVDSYTQRIIKFAELQNVGEDVITLRRFMELLSTYVTCMNSGTIPCIQSATEQLKEAEFKHACNKSEEMYTVTVNEFLQQHIPDPVELEEMEACHKEAFALAVKIYTQLVFVSDKDDTSRKQTILHKLLQLHQTYVKENENKSEEKCRITIQECFKNRFNAVRSQQYFCQGGHKMYEEASKIAIYEYYETPNKGPMTEDILAQFMEEHQSENDAIISADKLAEEWEIKQTQLKDKLEETNQMLELTQKKQEEHTTTINTLHQNQTNDKNKLQQQIEEKSKLIRRYETDVSDMRLILSTYQKQWQNADADYKRQMADIAAQLQKLYKREKKSKLPKWWPKKDPTAAASGLYQQYQVTSPDGRAMNPYLQRELYLKQCSESNHGVYEDLDDIVGDIYLTAQPSKGNHGNGYLTLSELQ